MAQKMEKENVDEGELFLVQLSKEDLKKMGFSDDTVQKYECVDVFLIWKGDDFSVRFVWHDHETQTYIEKVSETPRWIFNFIVEKYIES